MGLVNTLSVSGSIEWSWGEKEEMSVLKRDSSVFKSGTKGGEKVEMVAEIAEIKERRHKMGFYLGWKEMLQKYKTLENL